MRRLLLSVVVYCGLVAPGPAVLADVAPWSCVAELVGGRWLWSAGCETCTTDTDCMERFGGDGGPGVAR